jgi:beta-glucanase (GH16 family)
MAVTWTLVFEDTFSGTVLDSAKWVPQFPWGTISSNTPDMIYKTSNVTVASGTCKIDVKRENTTVNGTTYHYSSGIITSSAHWELGETEADYKYLFTYGAAEISMKVPVDNGVEPAFWLLRPQGVWPPEIDVMEGLDWTNKRNVALHYHYDDGVNDQDSGANYSIPTSTSDMTGTFHTYRVEWLPSSIRWFIDGVEARSAFVGSYVSNWPMYLLANVQVGLVGNPATATMPASANIDYIRVYSGTPTTAFRPAQCSSAVDAAVTYASTLYNLPRYWMYAICQRESSFQEDAVNQSNGGVGLTQLTGEKDNGSIYPMGLSTPDNNHLQWTYDKGFGTFGVWLNMDQVTPLASASSWAEPTAQMKRFATVFAVRWYQRLKRTYPTESTTQLLSRAAFQWNHGIFSQYNANDSYLVQYNQYMAEFQPACEANDGLWNGSPDIFTGSGTAPPGTGSSGGGGTSSPTWVTPRTWADGEVVTVGYFNTHIRDNVRYLQQTGLMKREGGVTTESSTTSTVNVDVVTVSGLSIPPDKPIVLMVQFRKVVPAVASRSAGIGWSMNGTIIGEVHLSYGGRQGLGALEGTVAVTTQAGLSITWVGPRVPSSGTTYLRTAFTNVLATDPTGTGNTLQSRFPVDDLNMPTNTTTAITIRGRVESSDASTLYVSQVHIYTVGNL